MANHIVLFEPLMPANTGNIARTCAGTNTELHLIEPLGFSTDDKYLKRAGLDYWDKVKITYHANLPAFLETLGADAKLHVVSKFANLAYTEVDYTEPKTEHYFLFERKRLACQKILCAKMKKSVFGSHKTMNTFGR